MNNVDHHDLEDICGIVLDSYEEDEVEKDSRFSCDVIYIGRRGWYDRYGHDRTNNSSF